MYTEVIYFKTIHEINNLKLMRVTKNRKAFNSINNNININEYL